MIFTSIEFLVFLPVVFTLYWLLNRHTRWQNLLVVAASYVFYGWWDWRFLLLIAFTSLCSWLSGLLMRNPGKEGQPKAERHRNKWLLWGNVLVNLAILGLFKYYDFFAAELADLLGVSGDKVMLHLILPVGISFYTFQALSYSIDVYKGRIEPTRDVVSFFAYVSFFPQLVAGPIERATNLLPQFQKQRQFDYGMAVDGVRQMLWGFFKKVVVADNCATYVDEIWGNVAWQGSLNLILAAVLFSIQIYCDFSGYSDIAIGTAKLFGIRLMRNFKCPYFSRDIAEFWRRWHISLTTWFRDYIYIPLGGSRVGKWKIVRNTFVIFLVSGLWHGANWTFLAWGAFHALLFLPLILLGLNRKYTDTVADGRWLPNLKELGQMALTFVLAMFGWILFRSQSIGEAFGFVGGIFTGGLADCSFPKRTFCFVLVLIVVEWLQRKREHGLSMEGVRSGVVRYACYLVTLALIFMYGVFNETFIYFQF
ncbi:MAG: MBOAT family protein [Bacteroidales bacterium]|nr:MBOAT family protein [Bacteroidales bacterium]